MMLHNSPWTTTGDRMSEHPIKSTDFGFQKFNFFFKTKMKMFFHYLFFSILKKKMFEIPSPPPPPKILNSRAII